MQRHMITTMPAGIEPAEFVECLQWKTVPAGIKPADHSKKTLNWTNICNPKSHVQFHVLHHWVAKSKKVASRVRECINVLVKFLLVPYVSLRKSKTYSLWCNKLLVNHWNCFVCLEVKTCWSWTCWLYQTVTKTWECNETCQPRRLLVSNLLTLRHAGTQRQCLLVSNLMAISRNMSWTDICNQKTHVHFFVFHLFMAKSNIVTCWLKRCIDMLIKYLLVLSVALRLWISFSFRCKTSLANHWDCVFFALKS